MKKILVPVDFSPEAASALDLALQMASAYKAKVTVLHAVEYPLTGSDAFGVVDAYALGPEFIGMLEENGKKQMGAFLGKFPASDQVITSVEIGHPYTIIKDNIDRNAFDLVIMGTKGAAGMKEYFVGSNTEKIVRVSNSPVISIKKKVRLSNLKNIVFPIREEGDASEDFMNHVRQLQKQLGATIHMVRINTPVDFQRDVVTGRFFDKLIRDYKIKDFRTHIYNDISENQGILSFAEEINADMIALGTHGRRGLSHLLSGSVAEEVVNRADRPIWTYRIGAKK